MAHTPAASSPSATSVRRRFEPHYERHCGRNRCLRASQPVRRDSGRTSSLSRTRINDRIPQLTLTTSLHAASGLAHAASRIVLPEVHRAAYAALCPAMRRHSSMNLSTSVGSNRSGPRPGPIFTAGRYGFRLPEACCTTHETLTPSFLATSFARTS